MNIATRLARIEQRVAEAGPPGPCPYDLTLLTDES